MIVGFSSADHPPGTSNAFGSNDHDVAPEWLLVGVVGAAVVTVAVGAIFFAGALLFPTADRPRTYGGETRRRTEIREYLSAIGERFAEDHPVAGQPVAFYLPERDVAITFDARAYFRIDGSPTRAVLVEHEMPGVYLGNRLPFETPSVETDAVDAAAGAFAVLGVPATASAREVKRAYRRKVKQVHPDHGGDREEFERLREAYAAAKRRAS